MNKLLDIKTVFTLGIVIGLLQVVISLTFYLGFPEFYSSLKHNIVLLLIWNLSIIGSMVYYFRLHTETSFRIFFAYTLMVMMVSFVIERFYLMLHFLVDSDIAIVLKDACVKFSNQMLEALTAENEEVDMSEIMSEEDITKQCAQNNDTLFTASGFFKSLIWSVPKYAILCILYSALSLVVTKLVKTDNHA